MALISSEFPNYESISGTLYIGTTGNIPYNPAGSGAIRLSDREGIPTVFNSGRINTDFRILPTGSRSDAGLFFEASTSRLGINTTDPGAALHIKDACADGGLKIENSSSCESGVILSLLHKPESGPEIGDIPSRINLLGAVATTMEERIYAQIRATILDSNKTTSSGELSFYVDQTGLLTPVFVGSVQKTVLGINNTDINNLYHTIIGASNYITDANESILIGNNNSGINIGNSIIVGQDTTISGLNTINLANNSTSSGNNNKLYGLNILSIGDTNTIFATSGSVLGSNTIVLGNNTSYIGNSGIILGYLTTISGLYNVAVGTNNAISGSNNLYYGNNNVVNTGNNIIGIGSEQNITNSNSGIFIGNNISNINANGTIVIGLTNNYGVLPSSLLFGNLNTINNGSVGLVLYGQYNNLQAGSGSLVFGEYNNISGSLYNLVVGNKNNNIGDSNNNIYLGSYVNDTGVFVSTSGREGTSSVPLSCINDHNIAIGINNISHNSDNSILAGHKNIGSGNNNLIYGSFNKSLRDANYIVGHSNSAVGTTNIIVGSGNRTFGNKNINIGTNSLVYGDDAISIGSNKFIVSGCVIGSNNIVNNLHNIVYGKNNIIGSGSFLYAFTANLEATTLNLEPYPDSANLTADDVIGIYVMNQNKTIGYSQFEYSSLGAGNFDVVNYTPSTEQLFSILKHFDDRITDPTVVSGYIMKVSESDGTTYGLNNVVLGNNILVHYNSGVYVGHNIASTGDNVVAIGNNIGTELNNAVILKTTNKNEFISSDDGLIINRNNGQSGVYIYSSNGNIPSFVADLSNNRIGVNNAIPTTDLDVSGIIKAKSIILTDNPVSGYVLTSNGNGSGSWTQNVNTKGVDNSLAVLLPNSTVSGVDGIAFVSANTGLNFYDSSLLINPLGVTLNNIPFTILDNSDNEIFLVKSDGSVSGNILQSSTLKVDGNVTLPSGSLSGSLLYVDTNGQLSANRLDESYCILFNNSENIADGLSTLRYFVNDEVLAFGANANSNDEFDAGDYDIILSANTDIDTIFNRRRLAIDMSFMASEADVGIQGMHYSSSGVLSVGTTGPINLDDNVVARIVGKLRADEIRLGTSTSSGYYLRAKDNSGNLEFTPLQLPISQRALYPLNATLVQGLNLYTVQIGNEKSSTDNNEMEGGNAIDGGKVLVYRGSSSESNRWVTSTNLRIRPGDCDGTCYDGLEIGKRTSTLRTNGGFSYSAGAFDALSNSYQNKYNGSAQYSIYHLTNATSGVQTKELLTNFPNVTTVTPNNTIAFNDTSNDQAYSITDTYRQYIWQYNISVNAIWQSGTDATTINGASFVYEGVAKCTRNTNNDLISLTNIGTPIVRSYMPEGINPTISGIVKLSNENNISRLQILGSGNTANYRVKWSAVGNINQINLPLDGFNTGFFA